MEVIACIPELPCPPVAGGAGLSASRGAGEARIVAARIGGERTVGGHGAEAAVPHPAAGEPSNTGVTDAAGDIEPGGRGTRRNRSVGRRPVTVFPTPAVLALAVIAAAVWTAAWRSERLRALEQRRPDRVALEPAPTAAAARSVMP